MMGCCRKEKKQIIGYKGKLGIVMNYASNRNLLKCCSSGG